MDGSSRAITQYDSQETQPPEFPLEDSSTPLTKIRLVPNTDMWFGHRDVASAISETIRTYYKDAFTCWWDTPEDHRRFWWNYFKQRFTWDPKHEALVRREWQQKARVRVKDIVNKAARGSPDKIITWMTDDLCASLRHKRESDEEFK